MKDTVRINYSLYTKSEFGVGVVSKYQRWKNAVKQNQRIVLLISIVWR